MKQPMSFWWVPYVVLVTSCAGPTLGADPEPEDNTLDCDLTDPSRPAPLPDGPSSERHTARPLGSTEAAQGYYEYLPPGYWDCQPRPLLIFFHGVGENGNGDSELSRVPNNGPPRLIRTDEWPSDRPFVVLSPQHPGGGCPGAAEIEAFITFALTHYEVDAQRLYLTGLSCGGIGLWGYLGAHTNERAAAAVPIAGDGRGAWGQAGCELGTLPIWAFHGDADGTVNVAGTNEPMDHLLDECPSPPRQEVIKTIYPGVGHDSWSRTYNLSAGHDIYSWLLTKTNDAATRPEVSDEPLAAGRTLLIDFGGTAATTSGHWNNITDVNGTLWDAKDDQGSGTKVDVAVSGFSGINEQGPPSNDLGYPTSASSDMIWLGSFDGHAAALTLTGTVQFSGLEPGTYTLRAFAARAGDDSGNGRLTRYTVDGTDVDVDASDNTSERAEFAGLTPDSAGRLTLTVTVSPAGTSRFAYLNVLEVVRAP